MKKTVLFLLFLGLLHFHVDAQIFKRQKDRAKARTEQNAQNKVDRKVDQAVDDAFNKIGGLFKKKKKNQTENSEDYEEETSYEEDGMNDRDFAAMMMGKSASEMGLPDAYDFSTNLAMQVTYSNKRGKKDSYNMNYLFADNGNYTGYEMEQSISGIIDMDRSQIVSVMADQQMATVMKMETVADIADDYSSDSENGNFEEHFENLKITKTGKTKTIAGYSCEQYLMENDEMDGDMWIATNFKNADLLQLSGGMAQMMQQNKKLNLPEEYIDLMRSGFMFEGTFNQKESKEQTHMLVTDIDENGSEISLKGYKIMDMSGFMNKN